MLTKVHFILLPETSQMCFKLVPTAVTFQAFPSLHFLLYLLVSQKAKERLPSQETSLIKMKTELKC